MIENDAVKAPRHYFHPSGIEAIDITRHETFVRGNIVKYVLRAPYKGSELQDLLKAQQYLAWEIERVQAQETPPQTDREKAEEWIAAVDSGEAGYCSFGEHYEGGDALAAKINTAAATGAISGFLIGRSTDDAPQAGDPVTIRRINIAPSADHLAPVTDLTARRTRTRIHPSPCACKTDGTVA